MTVHVQSQPPLGDLLDRLARELLAQPTSQDVLDRVAVLASQGIPGAASVGISMVEKGRRVSTVAASSELARQGDALQYEFGEGPCLDAVWAEEEVHAADLAADERWPHWGPRVAADLGVRSMLSVQLATPQRTLGAVNIYGIDVHAFDSAAITVAGSFATQAGVALSGRLQQENLESALVTRNLIGQAQGILMERYKITADGAFDVLATTSQRSNVKLVEVARRVAATGESPHAVVKRLSGGETRLPG